MRGFGDKYWRNICSKLKISSILECWVVHPLPLDNLEDYLCFLNLRILRRLFWIGIYFAYIIFSPNNNFQVHSFSFIIHIYGNCKETVCILDRSPFTPYTCIQQPTVEYDKVQKNVDSVKTFRFKNKNKKSYYVSMAMYPEK